MKNFYRIFGLALIVGLVMMLVGWSNNGVKPIIANRNYFTLKAIDNTKLTRTYISNRKFNKVFVQTDSSDIYLHSGKNYQVRVTGVNPDAVQVKIANNRLDIYEPKPLAINWGTNAENECPSLPVGSLIHTAYGPYKNNWREIADSLEALADVRTEAE